jgi:hypothetical protein
MALTLRLAKQGATESYAPVRSVGNPPNGVLGVVIPTGSGERPHFVVDSSEAIVRDPFVPMEPGEELETSAPVELEEVLDGLDALAAAHLWKMLTAAIGSRVVQQAVVGNLGPISMWERLLHEVAEGLVERGFFHRAEDEGGEPA